MAIFSLRHTWLGKSHKDYKPGVGRAHANYITRQSSCTKLIGQRVPTHREALKAWLHRQETNDRKNARIIDKIMIALPVELTPDQRLALVRDFCEHVTEGRASWIAAVHDRGKDAKNPHTHIILRDRDVETGRRVMMTTELGSTERFRKAWEQVANSALQRAGLEVRIDRRSLAAQGIDRKAEEHRGPTSKLVPEADRQHEAGMELPTRDGLAAANPEKDMPSEEATKGVKGRLFSNVGNPEWTGRGGLVAQQWSATRWAKTANARRRADEAKAPGKEPQAATGPQDFTNGVALGSARSTGFRARLTKEQKDKAVNNLPALGKGGLTL